MPMFGMRPPEEEYNLTPRAKQMLQNAPRMEDKPKRQSYWQGGDKFTLRDGIGAALMAVGDGFSNWANGPGAGGNVRSLIGGRQSALEQAQAARAQAQAAIAAEERRQRERGEKLEDLRGELKVRSEFEKPEAPRFEQDNAGNVWALDPRTGRPMSESPVFVDRTERFMNQNGAILNVPNPYAQQPQGLPPIGSTRPKPGAQQQQSAPIQQMPMTPQAQFYLDEAKKLEMLEEARRDGRGYMQRMGY